MVERTERARASGALVPTDTTEDTIDDAGVRFIVRCVSSLARKEKARAAASTHSQPKPDSREFPFERPLIVRNVSDTHVAVLNKFPVVPHHVLLVTRRFAEQQSLLDRDDFQALAACMQQYDALGFYNGGPNAGASRQHKHLQLVPLPLRPDDPVPMDALFEPLRGASSVLHVAGFAFRHAFAWREHDGTWTAASLLRTYSALLSVAGIQGVTVDGVTHQSAPYNLLVTREWMLLVPRSAPCVEDIPINALGYAGSMFVKDEAQLRTLRRMGPMAALAAVAC